VNKPLLDVLNGKRAAIPPIWLMRQAGRYLPEYRALRQQAGGFLDLVFNPKLAAEVTLQPLRRFGFDAAILFSDILVIPFALGQGLSFTAGEGPQLDPIKNRDDFVKLAIELDHDALAPIYETVATVKDRLEPQTTLLGFCGAPWTVATYMVAGCGTSDQAPARLFAYRDRPAFGVLIDVLVEASAAYLVGQLKAGADAVQIFDTWAGTLSADECYRWCVEPVQRVVSKVREVIPDAKIIGFPRGAGTSLPRYASETRVNAIGLDWMIDLAFARDQVQTRVPVQGNLDPLALVAGGSALDRAVDLIMEALSGGPFIFNLGHGIVPETPIEHVEQMLARVRQMRR